MAAGAAVRVVGAPVVHRVAAARVQLTAAVVATVEAAARSLHLIAAWTLQLEAAACLHLAEAVVAILGGCPKNLEGPALVKVPAPKDSPVATLLWREARSALSEAALAGTVAFIELALVGS